MLQTMESLVSGINLRSIRADTCTIWVGAGAVWIGAGAVWIGAGAVWIGASAIRIRCGVWVRVGRGSGAVWVGASSIVGVAVGSAGAGATAAVGGVLADSSGVDVCLPVEAERCLALHEAVTSPLVRLCWPRMSLRWRQSHGGNANWHQRHGSEKYSKSSRKTGRKKKRPCFLPRNSGIYCNGDLTIDWKTVLDDRVKRNSLRRKEL